MGCDLVVVTWLDSRQSSGGWKWLSELEERDPIECQSVGWLIQDGDDAKVLAQSMAPDGDDMQYAGDKIIPSRAVLKIERLTEVRPSAREAAE